MKASAVFLAAAFCVQWILSPIPIAISKASATPNPAPCQSHAYYNFMEFGLSFRYAECKNIILQPGKELSINVSADNVERIFFRNSILPAIPPGAFTSFTKLSELYLNRNGLKMILPGIFNGLPQLQLLHLQDNNIMKISNGTLNSLTNLAILDVSRNAIISLEQGCFAGLVDLRLLSLNHNNLYFLDPDTFVSLTMLEILDLSHNYLFMSDFNFTLNLNTPYLGKLLINNNLLQHFSVSSVENLNGLELLDVSFNYLIEVDFGSIIPPKFANFSNNQIATLKGWSDLHQSSIVDLTKNKINSSKQITGDTKKLYLGQNEMESLDSCMFVNSAGIIEVDLSYNYIREIANDSFQGLVNLETLYLNNNEIIYLPMGCFSDLDTLKLLSLSQNSLRYLQNDIFAGLSKLTNLYLDYNRLSIINEKTFYGLDNLQNLYLNHNLLTSINIEAFLKHLPNLNTIYLKNNYWDCREFLNITEALHNHSVKLPEGNDFDTTQVFEIACDNLNLKVISHRNINREFIHVLYKTCTYFMLFAVTLLDVLIITWYFVRFKVTLRKTETKIRQIKIAITRIET